MPLFHLTGDQRQLCFKFFKENSTENLMGKKELKAILAKHNIEATDDELQQMIDLISLNEKGISLEGFTNYMAHHHGRDSIEEYLEAFRAFDIDGDGSITKDEVKYMATLIGTQINWDTLIKEADKNADGKIDFDEFCELMRKDEARRNSLISF